MWDYFGFQVGVNLTDYNRPVAFPWLAYNMIWNEFIRDENLQDEVLNGPLTQTSGSSPNYRVNNNILYRCWKKDYFTSALPFQQRGIAPALPISGFSSAVFSSIDNIDVMAPQQAGGFSAGLKPLQYASSDGNTAVLRGTQNGALYSNQPDDPTPPYEIQIRGYDLETKLSGSAHNTVDFSNALGSDINDLRLAIALQHRGEISARGGQRYVEFLQSNYGAFPRDERLQRQNILEEQ